VVGRLVYVDSVAKACHDVNKTAELCAFSREGTVVCIYSRSRASNSLTLDLAFRRRRLKTPLSVRYAISYTVSHKKEDSVLLPVDYTKSIESSENFSMLLS